jgi:drug/metabolite transporter (DMT)-like permease
MDKATKRQFSIVAFIIGLIMLFIPYLKSFDSLVPGISQYFSIMFYLGLLLVVIGYYLK